MKNHPRKRSSKRTNVRRKDVHISVRSVRRAEPDIDKLVQALIGLAVAKDKEENRNWYRPED